VTGLVGLFQTVAVCGSGWRDLNRRPLRPERGHALMCVVVQCQAVLLAAHGLAGSGSPRQAVAKVSLPSCCLVEVASDALRDLRVTSPFWCVGRAVIVLIRVLTSRCWMPDIGGRSCWFGGTRGGTEGELIRRSRRTVAALQRLP
jgi:hypothetical protein